MAGLADEKVFALWTDAQTEELIKIWSQEAMQTMLKSSRRNSRVFKLISDHLSRKGVKRSPEQCRTKIKNLKTEYKQTVNSNSGTSNKICRFFDQLDVILGNTTEYSTVPTVMHDSFSTTYSSPVVVYETVHHDEILNSLADDNRKKKRKRCRPGSSEYSVADALRDVTQKLIEFEKARDDRMMAFFREERERAEQAKQEDAEREERIIKLILNHSKQ